MTAENDVHYDVSSDESGALRIVRTMKHGIATDLSNSGLIGPIDSVDDDGRVWLCVTCSSDPTNPVSVKAYTEVDAGFKQCGLQSFSVQRGKCKTTD